MEVLPCLLAIPAALAVTTTVCGGTDLHIHRKSRTGATRVACVGDSITNGALIPGCFSASYPARLQKMLGKQYHVENFGLNDRTAQASGQKPYCAEKEYQRSLDFRPEIVILMMGSNDTKPVSWDSPERFVSEYQTLLDSYLSLDESPRVILCTPPWAMEPVSLLQKPTNDIDAARLPEIAELIRSIGQRHDLPVIDLYPLFQGRKDLLCFDALHPNRKGAALIAEQVCLQIKSKA